MDLTFVFIQTTRRAVPSSCLAVTNHHHTINPDPSSPPDDPNRPTHESEKDSPYSLSSSLHISKFSKHLNRKSKRFYIIIPPLFQNSTTSIAHHSSTVWISSPETPHCDRSDGWDRMELDVRSEMMDEECTTPKRRECRIPVGCVCPPPPKKKTACGTKRDPPKNGYFQPPDLDALFLIPTRRHQACA